MSRATLLIAEDNRLVMITLAEGLRRAGYTVLEATNGEEAVQIASTASPDLAILDMRMPKRSGLEVAHWLRQHTDIPFIFLSAYGDSTMVDEAVRAGALGYLIKPLDLQQIIPPIEAALRRGRELKALLEEGSNLSAALRVGRETSMAIGILMARYQLDEQEAFNQLRAEARSQRRRVSDLAAELISSVEPGKNTDGPKPA